jgi:hypothetical protein
MKPPVKRTILVAVLVSVTGGWMAFDGAHALITGDFVTPSSGPYSGQLGPWATLLEAVGLEPRSLGVKIFFLLFGIVYLSALGAFLLRFDRSRLVLAACAVVALLYLPIGTASSALVLAVLATTRPRNRPSLQG